MKTARASLRLRDRLAPAVFLLSLLILTRASAETDPQCEVGDAVFRHGNFLGLYPSHGAIYYGYFYTWDAYYRHTVIQASGGSWAVDYQPFDYVTTTTTPAPRPRFVTDPNDYTAIGPRNRSNQIPPTWNGSANSMDATRRNSIITEAQKLIGTGYCLYWGIWQDTPYHDGSVSCEPRAAYPTYPSLIRCDGVVQWVYERVGFNMGDRTLNVLAGPYPSDRAGRMNAASVDAPSTTVQDNGATCTITTEDSSSQPTYVTVSYPDGTIRRYNSPATITKQTGTTFYWGSDSANHQGGGNWFDYTPQGQPDLTIVGQVGVSPTSVAQGGTVQVGWTEKNQGTAASAPAHHTRISLSSSAYGTTYLLSYYGPMTTLSVGESHSYSQSIVVPGSIPAGTYYVTAFIDCEGQVPESNDGNNIGSSSPSGLTVSISQTAPSKATSPSPGNGAAGQSIIPSLSWADGGGAASYDVYFNGQFKGNQPGTSYSPGTLAYNTTYSWRIDARNSVGVTTGDIWSFTTAAAPLQLPLKATNPNPGNGATGQSISPSLSWANGGGAESYDVYFNGQYKGNQTATSYSPGTLANNTAYSWRIDARNSVGVTAGDTWSFTTGTTPPPGVSWISPTSGPTSGGTVVTITGANLANGPVTVYFGTTSAIISSASDSQIIATSPAGAVGTVDVTVVTAGGTSLTSSLDQFTYMSSTPPTGTPDIAVKGWYGGVAHDIFAGKPNPTWADGTEFGAVAQNSTPPTRTYTVRNTGTASLTLSTPTVPSGFTIVEPLNSTIPAGGSDDFTVQMNTTNGGTFSGNISIPNNAIVEDGAKNPFRFAIHGTVIYAGVATTATVLSNSPSSIIYGEPVTFTANVSILPLGSGTPDGGTVTFLAGETVLGTASISAGTAALTTTALTVGSQLVRAIYSGDGSDCPGSSSLMIGTVAGNGTGGYGGDGGQAVGASLSRPFSVALDDAGNLFIADRVNNRIRKVHLPTGIITTIAGNGVKGYNGDNIQATEASLNLPEGVAVDRYGHLFVADSGNYRIRVVDLSTGVITTVAGNGTYGYSGDGGQATNAMLRPYSVAVDGNGNIFTSDMTGSRVRRIDSSTKIITTFAGNGTSGFSGDGGLATAASLNHPGGIAVDTSTNVFIADWDNGRIRRVDASSGMITTVAGDGTGVFNGDGIQATAASVSPRGVAVDADGNLFIADYGHVRVRKVDHMTGIITTIAGDGMSDYYGDGGPPTAAAFRYLEQVVVATNGDLFIADRGNDRIRQVTPAVSIPVTPATLTVTADSKSRIYGAADPPFTATISGFQNGETLDTSGVSGNPNLTSSDTTVSPVGSYTISAGLGTLTAQNYTFQFANGTLSITPATLMIAADNLSRMCGDPNPTFTASYTGFRNGETLATSGVTGSPNLTCSATTTSPPGDYTIVAGLGTLVGQNYNFIFFDGTLTVIQPIITVRNTGLLEISEGVMNNDVFVNEMQGILLQSGGELYSGNGTNFGSWTISGGVATLTTFFNALGGTFNLSGGSALVPLQMNNMGTFTQSGGLFDPVFYDNTGTLQITGGTNSATVFYNEATGVVVLQSGEHNVNYANNFGSWTIFGGTANLTNLLIESGGVFTNAGGTLFSRNAQCQGVIDVRDGTLALNSGTVTVDRFFATNFASSVVNINGGTLNSGGSTVNNGSVFQVGNGTGAATLHLMGGAHSFANDLFINTNASLTGTGAITGAITSAGTIAPGDSAGILTGSSDLTLLTESLLLMELTGTNDWLYDQIILAGFLNFGGTLTVSLLDGFTPSAGNRFDLFDFTTSSGFFTSTNLPSLPAGLVWDTSLLYTSGEIETEQGGSLQVNITPSEAVSAGAKWQVDSGGWNNSGDIVIGLVAGSHTVSYTNLTGWIKPADQIVQVNAGALSQTNGNYELTPVLLAAASRKVHGSAGTFALNLNLNAASPTVEPRRYGPTQVAFSFNKDMMAADGTLDASEFVLTNATFVSASIASSNLTLNLTNVVDQSLVTVVLNGISDLAGNPLEGTNAVVIRALYGDCNQSGTVSAPDLQYVKNRLLQTANAANYLADLNLSGSISAPDLQQVKNNLLHTVQMGGFAPSSGDTVGGVTQTFLSAASSSGTDRSVCPTTLGEAVGAPELEWRTNGDELWVPTLAEDGTAAAWSGSFGDLLVSWLETTVTGPGTITFQWKVSSEFNADFLTFSMDGADQPGRISGEVDWQPLTFSIPAGTHLLRWTYAKNGEKSAGLDSGWVRRVSYQPRQ